MTEIILKMRADHAAWLTVTHSIIAICLVFIGLDLAFVIGSRHDATVRKIFWLFGLFLVLCGLSRVFFIATLQGVNITGWAVFASWLMAGFSVSFTAMLIWITPRVMKVPNVRQLFDLNKDAQRDTYAIRQQLSEVAEVVGGLSDEDEHKIRLAFAAIKRILTKSIESAKE